MLYITKAESTTYLLTRYLVCTYLHTLSQNISTVWIDYWHTHSAYNPEQGGIRYMVQLLCGLWDTGACRANFTLWYEPGPYLLLWHTYHMYSSRQIIGTIYVRKAVQRALVRPHAKRQQLPPSPSPTTNLHNVPRATSTHALIAQLDYRTHRALVENYTGL